MKYEDARVVAKRELLVQQEYAGKKDPMVLSIPLLLGSVGSGKTGMVRDLAKEFDLPLLTINGGENSDPTDIAGIPDILNKSKDDDLSLNYTEWSLNKFAAMACDRPVMLFFDDIDKAAPSVVNALLGVFANRLFRDKELSAGTLVIAAGNRLEDDLHANELSESMLTRVTAIELEPDLKSFTTWGVATGRIHPLVLGYLQYAPQNFNSSKRTQGQYSCPVSRRWEETSRHMAMFPAADESIGGTSNWCSIVSRKCGDAVGRDFWAWYSILKNIDVDALLVRGDLSAMPTADDKKRQWMYAAVFVLAAELQKGIKPSYTGLEKVLAALPPELCLALAVQLPQSIRLQISNVHPEALALLTKALGS